ncbi:hypothetical protein RHIZ_06155 [Rhizobium skierniewicense]|uniref:hypothetical protein n=1 Tax=Rhizobium skierniewicense TaxID=984260 RepID=UPI001FAD9132|nr:hypothetical protein [Rhizobium skierniewicense]MCI9865523.1 hypothetical protein [Rhizobium skierniewicense]
MRHQLYRLKEAFTVKAITDKAVEREFVRVTGGAGGLLSMLTGHAVGETQSPWTATGVKFQEGGTDWRVERCTMKGFRTRPAPGKTYWQGDGFATEHPNARITFERCQAFENADAGFDLKGPDFLLDRCKSVRNGKNYRLWSGGEVTTIESVDPKVCHLHICISAQHSERQVIEIGHLIASGDKPLLYVETVKGAIPPRIIIDKLTLTRVSKILQVSGPQPDITWPNATP